MTAMEAAAEWEAAIRDAVMPVVKTSSSSAASCSAVLCTICRANGEAQAFGCTTPAVVCHGSTVNSSDSISGNTVGLHHTLVATLAYQQQ